MPKKISKPNKYLVLVVPEEDVSAFPVLTTPTQWVPSEHIRSVAYATHDSVTFSPSTVTDAAKQKVIRQLRKLADWLEKSSVIS